MTHFLRSDRKQVRDFEPVLKRFRVHPFRLPHFRERSLAVRKLHSCNVFADFNLSKPD
jgi:hypothetical protein